MTVHLLSQTQTVGVNLSWNLLPSPSHPTPCCLLSFVNFTSVHCVHSLRPLVWPGNTPFPMGVVVFSSSVLTLPISLWLQFTLHIAVKIVFLEHESNPVSPVYSPPHGLCPLSAPSSHSNSQGSLDPHTLDLILFPERSLTLSASVSAAHSVASAKTPFIFRDSSVVPPAGICALSVLLYSSMCRCTHLYLGCIIITSARCCCNHLSGFISPTGRWATGGARIPFFHLIIFSHQPSA